MDTMRESAVDFFREGAEHHARQFAAGLTHGGLTDVVRRAPHIQPAETLQQALGDLQDALEVTGEHLTIGNPPRSPAFVYGAGLCWWSAFIAAAREIEPEPARAACLLAIAAVDFRARCAEAAGISEEQLDQLDLAELGVDEVHQLLAQFGTADELVHFMATVAVFALVSEVIASPEAEPWGFLERAAQVVPSAIVMVTPAGRAEA